MEKAKQPVMPIAPKGPSPLDLWQRMGGKARPVAGLKKPPEDSLLAVYKDRLTYTFIFGREVASIHFDRSKREIFFKGHNIKNMELSEAQKMALSGFKDVLAADERSRPFLKEYESTLLGIMEEGS